MKTLIATLFIIVNVFGCDLRSLNFKSESASEFIAPTPNSCGCGEKVYKHKSEREIAAMTPRQKLDELVNEKICHIPASDDNYEDIIYNYVHKDGVKVLPTLIEYIKGYEPKEASECEEMRFHVAYRRADSLDDTVVRLRGINEGKMIIDVLERATERMREAGYDQNPVKNKNDFESVEGCLEALKTVNLRDGFIKNTLQKQHGIQMTDKELSDFSDYLVSIDPTYPSWSKVSEDFSPGGLLKDSKKYYEAYLLFKAKK